MALDKNEAGRAVAAWLSASGPASCFVPVDGGMVGVVITPGRIQLVVEEGGSSVSFRCEASGGERGGYRALASAKEPGKRLREAPADMAFFLDAACPAILSCLRAES